MKEWAIYRDVWWTDVIEYSGYYWKDSFHFRVLVKSLFMFYAFSKRGGPGLNRVSWSDTNQETVRVLVDWLQLSINHLRTSHLSSQVNKTYSLGVVITSFQLFHSQTSYTWFLYFYIIVIVTDRTAGSWWPSSPPTCQSWRVMTAILTAWRYSYSSLTAKSAAREPGRMVARADKNMPAISKDRSRRGLFYYILWICICHVTGEIKLENIARNPTGSVSS